MNDYDGGTLQDLEAGAPLFTVQQLAEIAANGVCQAYAAYNNGSNITPVLAGYGNFTCIYVHETDPNVDPFAGLGSLRLENLASSAPVERVSAVYALACEQPSCCVPSQSPGTPSAGHQLFGFAATADDGSHNILMLRGTVTPEEAGYDLLGWGDNTVAKFTDANGKTHTCGNVNSYLYGFYKDTDYVFTSLEASCLSAVSNTNDINPNKPWLIGGHSLGGAMATLAVLSCRYMNYMDMSNTFVCTFGSLHVGDLSFAQGYYAQVVMTARFANLCDFVPSMVSLQPVTPVDPYVHVGAAGTFVWQTWDDWANHSLACIYMPVITNHWDLIQWGNRTYPQ